jgi:hypothetical protein
MSIRKTRRDVRRNDGVAREVGLAARMAGADEVDTYLAEIIGELERMARAHHKEMLAYLLSMAGIQAIAAKSSQNGSRVLH